MSELFLRLLPHCPNPVEIEASRQATGTYVAEVCDCPHDAGDRVHWLLDDGRQMHCPCGPRNPPVRSTPRGHAVLLAVTGAVACRSCAQGLYSRHFARRLEVTMRCCYCGGPAESGSGWTLKSHPSLGVPGARR